MYKSYVPYLQHILDECLYVRSVIKDDMQREEFLRDETLKSGCNIGWILGSWNLLPNSNRW
jgi:hypothetical protein